jgi:peptidase E
LDLFLTSVSNGISTIDFLKDRINDRTKLVVLPFAHDFKYISKAEDVYNHYDRNFLNKESIYWRTVEPFINIGINPDRIVIINIYADPIELIKYHLLSENTIVYLPGGFPENIVKLLNEFRLTETIKQCKIVVGESAGSMFWSKRFFVYPDNDYKRYRCYKGIKFIKDFVIIPHYNPWDHKQKIKILNSCRKFKRLHKEKVYLIKDGGWVWYNSENNKIVETKDCIKYE